MTMCFIQLLCHSGHVEVRSNVILVILRNFYLRSCHLPMLTALLSWYFSTALINLSSPDSSSGSWAKITVAEDLIWESQICDASLMLWSSVWIVMYTSRPWRNAHKAHTLRHSRPYHHRKLRSASAQLSSSHDATHLQDPPPHVPLAVYRSYSGTSRGVAIALRNSGSRSGRLRETSEK